MIVTDMIRGGETWLVDENLTRSMESGMGFASRLFYAEDFSMTCGVVVPVDADLIAEAVLDHAPWLDRLDLDQVPEDARFASAIYRTALSAGIMDDVVFEAASDGTTCDILADSGCALK